MEEETEPKASITPAEDAGPAPDPSTEPSVPLPADPEENDTTEVDLSAKVQNAFGRIYHEALEGVRTVEIDAFLIAWAAVAAAKTVGWLRRRRAVRTAKRTSWALKQRAFEPLKANEGVDDKHAMTIVTYNILADKYCMSKCAIPGPLSLQVANQVLAAPQVAGGQRFHWGEPIWGPYPP